MVSSQIPLFQTMSPVSEEFPITWKHTFRCSFKVVGHMKTSEGGLIGRTSNDTILEKMVGFELALVFFRKPSWQWHANLGQAQDLSKLSPETMALPPMTLFGPEWIDRAISICADSGMFSLDMQEPMEEFFYQVKSRLNDIRI